MKKIIPLCIIGIVAVIGYAVYKNKQASYAASTVPFVIQGKVYHVLTAKTDAERERGLMYLTHLQDADGMLFIFPTAEYQMFWNQNTYMNLTLYWYHDKTLLGISYLPSIAISKNPVTIQSPGPVNYVVEIPVK